MAKAITAGGTTTASNGTQPVITITDSTAKAHGKE
jgi:hypothetical protein